MTAYQLPTERSPCCSASGKHETMLLSCWSLVLRDCLQNPPPQLAPVRKTTCASVGPTRLIATAKYYLSDRTARDMGQWIYIRRQIETSCARSTVAPSTQKTW